MTLRTGNHAFGLTGLAGLVVATVLAGVAKPETLTLQKLQPGSAQSEYFVGRDLAVSGDFLVVGSHWVPCSSIPGDTRCGEAFVYRSNGGHWEETQTLRPPVEQDQMSFAYQLDIDGNTIMVAAQGLACDAGDKCGSVYVYEFDGTNWSDGQPLLSGDAPEGSLFGSEVRILGDRAFVGAPGEVCADLPNCGALYEFERVGSTWTLRLRLEPPQQHLRTGMKFGTTIETDGDWLFVGATGSCPDWNYYIEGRVFVYRRAGEDWVFEQVLRRSDYNYRHHDEFGRNIAFNGTDLVITSRNQVSCCSSCGEGDAYVFRRSGGQWVERQILPSVGEPAGWMRSVAFTSRSILVGRNTDCSGGIGCGSVTEYRRGTGGMWIAYSYLEAPVASQWFGFGSTMATRVYDFTVSAPGADCGGAGQYCGAVYTFRESVPQSRYVTITPKAELGETAVQVTLQDLYSPNPPVAGAPDFSAYHGEVRYLGSPTLVSEGLEGTPQFFVSELQCEPYLTDWSQVGTVSVYGAAIIPDSTYTFAPVDSEGTPIAGAGQLLAEGDSLSTGRWGDVVAPFAAESITAQPDVNDILAIVDKFLGDSFPRKASAQLLGNVLDPTAKVQVNDFLAAVDAFLGKPYPYVGPTSCP